MTSRWNLSRLFVEKRHIAWVALIATLGWGTVSFLALPQRKDPEVVIKTAVITAGWPGATAADLEELVTEPLEQLARQVPRVDQVTSTTRAGLATVFVTLDDDAERADLDPAWADLRARLDLFERAMPPGAAPLQLNTHFGDTATVVYTVASPEVGDVELEVRSRAIERALVRHRAAIGATGPRQATVFVTAPDVPDDTVLAYARRYLAVGEAIGGLRGGAILRGASFVALDYEVDDPEAGARVLEAFRAQVMGDDRPHPDVWGPVLVTEPGEVRGALEGVAGARYSYRALDAYTALLRDELARHPEVTRVDRHGVVAERVHVLYSQQRLASFGLSPQQLGAALRTRNVSQAGGRIDAGGRALLVEPGGAFATVADLEEAIVGAAPSGHAVTVRDVAEVIRGYETPAPDTTWLTRRGSDGWARTRGVSLAVQVRSGAQVTAVGEALDQLVDRVAERLPADLEIVKTSDQPELVRTKIDEFLRSLLEAIAIVIAIALVFMERRSALLVAASIPITLAMTFGFMQLLGLDLQQVSIAALIIALGLLVDDPVIASDAINRELAAGVPRRRAAWQGPTRLAKAIFFATLTNVVAFAPLLLVSGSMGEFIYSLPMVVSLALVSSRIVSMTFMPLLGYYLLRGQRGYEASLEGDGRGARLARGYNALTEWTLRHKGKTALAFLAFLIVGLAPAVLVRTQFFPDEAMARFYVHVRLPEGADARATDALLREAEAALLAAEGERIERVTTYAGSGGPRWWSNVGPEPRNPAYGMMLIQARDADATRTMVGRIQRRLTGEVPGARFEVYRVSSGKPAVVPVEVRISGPDVATLRRLAEAVAAVLRAAPETSDVFDDWGPEAMNLELSLDPARAAAAGVTATDVARSSALALAGARETQLRVGDRLIDVVVRLRPDERGAAGQVGELYAWSERTGRAVPLEQVARVDTAFAPPKIVRHDLERTITIGAIPKDGALPSALLASAEAGLAALELPPGYHLELGGEHELQAKAFASVGIALKVSVALIFLVLVWQFAHVFKPLIVFAAIPFGLVGVVLGLTVTHTHFGFMAFLGVASLIGVIVSHIIVLFDFIEEAREHGVELHRAVIDAGLVRLRPVLVTVLATVGGLIPLAIEGGPMWRQLVYVQIGGLLLATVVTKGVVPLLYVVFTETFRLIRWEREDADALDGGAAAPAPRPDEASRSAT